jgi:hypothetical protein
MVVNHYVFLSCRLCSSHCTGRRYVAKVNRESKLYNISLAYELSGFTFLYREIEKKVKR